MPAAECPLHQAINTIQANIWNCVSLASQWKGLTAIVSRGMELDLIPEYRSLADILRPASNEFVRLCEVVNSAVVSAIQMHDDARFEGSGDLDLAYKVAVSVCAWLDCWPTSASDTREAARQEIREGNSRHWREIANAARGAQ